VPHRPRRDVRAGADPWNWRRGADLIFSSGALAEKGLMQRVSCAMVRVYVAKYSVSAAEMWARSHGATDAQIEAARECLKGTGEQAAQAARWFAR
jgi:hypothetical protein